MRQGPNGRRPRGRPNRKPHGGPSRPNSFDSAGPDGRIRGNAHQVYEKYVGLARDAISAGDRVAAEAFYQHAEHYFRIVNSSTDPETGDRRPPPRGEARDASGAEGQSPDAEAREASDRGDRGSSDRGSSDRGDRRPGNRNQGARGQNGRGPRDQGNWDQQAGDGGPPRAQRRRPDARDTVNGSGHESAETAPQSEAPQARVGEDREGLDRVLGQETAAPRRRPRQRPVRDKAADSDGGAKADSERAPHQGNGQAGIESAAPSAADTSAEPPEAGSPDEKKPDSEPVGA